MGALATDALGDFFGGAVGLTNLAATIFVFGATARGLVSRGWIVGVGIAAICGVGFLVGNAFTWVGVGVGVGNARTFGASFAIPTI